jgi:hypothetical protein
MELNSKVQELEDELKILKAEIRNVLLDIREVILDRTNPLSDEHESAFIRMDLNTTARALAAEVGAREAMKGAETTEAVPGEEEAEEEAGHAEADSHPDEQPSSDGDIDRDGTADGEDPPAVEAPHQPPKGKTRKGKGAKPAHGNLETADTGVERAGIPAMFRASASAASLASWVIGAVREIGPQQVDRIITIHRLCGTISPNVSEALAHVQELIRSSEEEEPTWLRVLQDLEDLA